MNTKIIFKTVALAMMMPAMLLTTACSNEDDVANTSNITSKGYALPVTVNVTRQDGATRATFDGSKLNFSAGDQLFVKGTDYDAGSFAGTLNYVSGGTFSGTIYTQYSFPSTAHVLFSAADSKRATLLPNGYGSTGFLSINNNGTPDDATDDDVSTNYAKAIALTKNAAVEQLSWERATVYDNGFALQPRSAILNFTITGLAASTQVAVVFTSNNGTVNENVTTNASGNATFALGVSGGEGLHNCTLSVGGNSITLVSSEKTLTAGKIYNISRSATPALNITSPSVGQVIGSDGKNYAYGSLPTGVTAVAKICYVSGSGSNGLALALTDEGKMDWSTAIETCAARTAPFTGGTWKLATKDEWDNMINAAGSYSALHDGFSSVGGTNMQSDYYWSSTEKDSNFAWYYDDQDLENWDSGDKEYNLYVRACLAF